MISNYIPAVIGIIACVSVLVYVHQSSKQSQASFAKSEINDRDYYALLAKYDYIKGSKQGDEFKAKLKDMLSDQMVSQYEYEKLTGDKATFAIYEKPEMANLYKDAKSNIIAISKN